MASFRRRLTNTRPQGADPAGHRGGNNASISAVQQAASVIATSVSWNETNRQLATWKKLQASAPALALIALRPASSASTKAGGRTPEASPRRRAGDSVSFPLTAGCRSPRQPAETAPDAAFVPPRWPADCTLGRVFVNLRRKRRHQVLQAFTKGLAISSACLSTTRARLAPYSGNAQYRLLVPSCQVSVHRSTNPHKISGALRYRSALGGYHTLPRLPRSCRQRCNTAVAGYRAAHPEHANGSVRHRPWRGGVGAARAVLAGGPGCSYRRYRGPHAEAARNAAASSAWPDARAAAGSSCAPLTRTGSEAHLAERDIWQVAPLVFGVGASPMPRERTVIARSSAGHEDQTQHTDTGSDLRTRPPGRTGEPSLCSPPVRPTGQRHAYRPGPDLARVAGYRDGTQITTPVRPARWTVLVDTSAIRPATPVRQVPRAPHRSGALGQFRRDLRVHRSCCATLRENRQGSTEIVAYTKCRQHGTDPESPSAPADEAAVSDSAVAPSRPWSADHDSRVTSRVQPRHQACASYRCPQRIR